LSRAILPPFPERGTRAVPSKEKRLSKQVPKNQPHAGKILRDMVAAEGGETMLPVMRLPAMDYAEKENRYRLREQFTDSLAPGTGKRGIIVGYRITGNL
jgi:hypothetical protein